MKIISGVFHPLLMATYLSSVLFIKAPEFFPRLSPQLIPRFVLIIFFITCLMPALSVFLLKKYSYISNLELTKRKERILPFIFITFYYAIASYLFEEKLKMGLLFMIVIISISVLIMLLLVITNWFKISIHSTAIWSGVGFIIASNMIIGLNTGYFVYLLILAAGLTCSSRLFLGYHQPKEIWLGALLGFAFSFFTIAVFF